MSSASLFVCSVSDARQTLAIRRLGAAQVPGRVVELGRVASVVGDKVVHLALKHLVDYRELKKPELVFDALAVIAGKSRPAHPRARAPHSRSAENFRIFNVLFGSPGATDRALGSTFMRRVAHDPAMFNTLSKLLRSVWVWGTRCSVAAVLFGRHPLAFTVFQVCFPSNR